MSDRPLRIVFVITELDPGGAERALVEIATRLATGGDQVAVICLGPEAELCDPLRAAGLDVTCLGWRQASDLRRIGKLRKAIRLHRPHVVASLLVHANIATAAALLGTKLPHVMGHRVAERGIPWHVTATRAMTRLRRTTHIAVSSDVADFLVTSRIAKRADVRIVHNGVDIERFRTAAPDASVWSEGTIRLLAIGRLEPQKNFGELVAAVNQLRETGRKVELCVAGEGSERPQLERSASEGVRLLGRVEDPAPLLAAADLFVLSSLWEGLPNVLLEAAAAGCPVMTTAVDGVCDVLPDGYPTAEPNAASLAAAIAENLDASDRKSRSESLQIVVAERFTWNTSAAAYRDALVEAIAPQQSPRDRQK